MKVVIIGAGIMGMLQARDLALKGLSVVLVDKNMCGTEASWAGGGIISPLYPWRYSEPVTTLASWSQSYYPNLAQSLEAESDVDPELTRHGLLMLQVEDQPQAIQWSSENRAWLKEISQAELYDLEPSLREGVTGALWMSQVASVRNPRLLKSVYTSLQRHPDVEIVEGAAVTAINKSGSRVSGVTLENQEQLDADAVVICSGAWSRGFLESEALQLKPVKGQMLVFDAAPGLVNRVVMNNGKYVIPRRDGKVLAGSTLEDVGFNKQTTLQAKDELADAAIDMFPELAACPIAHHWAGLRPCAPEGIPYIGRIPQFDNLYINAGHYRNGLVLAPASVALLSAIMTGTDLPFDGQAYDPARSMN